MGRVSSFLLQGNNAGIWYDQEKSEYTFDINGNGLSGAGFRWEANAWIHNDMFLEMSFNGNVGDGGYNGYEYTATYGTFTDIDNTPIIPAAFNLYQNYPNPFNPVTVLRYELPEASSVNMTVYNSLGEEVKEIINAEMPAGSYEMVYDSENLPSGTYFLKMNAAGISKVVKLVLIK